MSTGRHHHLRAAAETAVTRSRRRTRSAESRGTRFGWACERGGEEARTFSPLSFYTNQVSSVGSAELRAYEIAATRGECYGADEDDYSFALEFDDIAAPHVTTSTACCCGGRPEDRRRAAGEDNDPDSGHTGRLLQGRPCVWRRALLGRRGGISEALATRLMDSASPAVAFVVRSRLAAVRQALATFPGACEGADIGGNQEVRRLVALLLSREEVVLSEALAILDKS